MASLFSRMLDGSIPAHRVWDDERCFVIVDIRPLKRGHCLVIPKQEVDHWVDLEPSLAAHLMVVAQKVAAAQMELFEGARIGLMIAGFEVSHAHIHVTPIDSMDDLDFAQSISNVSDSELAVVAKSLIEVLAEDLRVTDEVE